MSYLNTKPMLYGLQNSMLADQLEVYLDYPSNLVRMLKSNEIDIGLIPVAALPSLGKYQIVSNFGIATEGEVASVALFSQVPMEEIEEVYLDYQSRTSVQLCQLLLEKHWKKSVRFIEAIGEEYIQDIQGNRAGLIIGDRALAFRSKAKYIYDLGSAWKQFTGLSFVFAVWVSLEQMSQPMIDKFSNAINEGINQMDKVIEENAIDYYDLHHYYYKNIQLRLSHSCKKGLEKFLEMIKEKS